MYQGKPANDDDFRVFMDAVESAAEHNHVDILAELIRELPSQLADDTFSMVNSSLSNGRDDVAVVILDSASYETGFLEDLVESAAAGGCSKSLKVLLDKLPDDDAVMETLMMETLMESSRDPAVMRLLLEKMGTQVSEESFVYAMYLACLHLQPETVKMLIAAGAAAQILSANDIQPLEQVIQVPCDKSRVEDKIGVINELLSGGACMYGFGYDRMNALHCCIDADGCKAGITRVAAA
jgi:hypothetical protein